MIRATFARVYASDLDGAVQALLAAGQQRVRLRFEHASGLGLALVDDVLVLAGSDEQLAPFRATAVTQIVEDLDDALAAAGAAGAEVVRPAESQPVGRNATVAFPQGFRVEYVEWNAETRTATGVG